MPNNFLTHFQQYDPIIYDLLVKNNIKKLRASDEDFFHLLCRTIIGQQLSTKVADVIGDRFTNLIPDLDPVIILEIDGEKLRAIGLSWSKIKYVKSLAEHVQNGTLKLQELPKLTDEEVITELTKVKGIGRWTAEMFLIFTLGREDVFSLGDLGLKRGLEIYTGLSWKEIEPSIDRYLTKWQHYRSYAALALWKLKDTN